MMAIAETKSDTPWHSRSAGETAEALGVDPGRGLDAAEVERRLTEYGPNELPTEPPPSVWVVARAQMLNPMNIMLLIVAIASFVIGQIPTGLVVAALVTFNVVMGSNQELKARASVEALAKLQVPHARVRRNGAVEEVESTGLVPGDIVLLEAGDVVPADGRIVDVGDARAPGGRADRRERAGGQGRDDRTRRRHGPRRPHEPRLPEHAGHARHGDGGRHGDRQRRPRWAGSPTWSPPPSGRARRCKASSTG